MSFHNRSWSFVKIHASESVDFSKVKQANFESCRKDTAISGSVATEYMIKWDGAEPAMIATMNAAGELAKYNVVGGVVTSGSGQFVFNHADTLAILATPRWTSNDIV